MQTFLFNHIVLAEDDQDHVFFFERAIKQVHPGVKLTIAQDGEQLLNLLSVIQPQLLFLDLNLPCKNGQECLQQIRSLPEHQHLRIVVYSSSAQMQDISNCYHDKADLYLVKPFDAVHLKNALHTLLTADWQSRFAAYHYHINNRFVPFTAVV